jgi:hypothetical protein
VFALQGGPVVSQADWRRRRKAGGGCTSCLDEPAEPGRTLCAYHAAGRRRGRPGRWDDEREAPGGGGGDLLDAIEVAYTVGGR